MDNIDGRKIPDQYREKISQKEGYPQIGPELDGIAHRR